MKTDMSIKGNDRIAETPIVQECDRARGGGGGDSPEFFFFSKAHKNFV